MPDNRPNILLLMTDQQRGDALGIEGHLVLQTPYLDRLAAAGIRFGKAYSACPVCIPARRTLMTGKKPASHGVLMNYHTWLEGPTLPGELTKAGYQTHLVGKLHLWPTRRLYGFMSEDWSDSPHEHERLDDDYTRFLRDHGVTETRPGVAPGAHWNGWTARPWHLDERLHFTSWCGQKACEFLERRDPTMPFFLKVSFHQPHQPCTPPQHYWDRYVSLELPEPYVGEWARVPFIFNFPDSVGIRQGRTIEQPVELMDVMPTLLDAAGVPRPEGVDGSSLLPLLRDGTTAWREYLHGECSAVPSLESGMQYLTDGRRKYIWFPGPGREQYFDLERDPREMHDLAARPEHADEIAPWRSRLVQELEGRPEGFVKNGKLVSLGRPTPACLPGYEKP